MIMFQSFNLSFSFYFHFFIILKFLIFLYFYLLLAKKFGGTLFVTKKLLREFPQKRGHGEMFPQEFPYPWSVGEWGSVSPTLGGAIPVEHCYLQPIFNWNIKWCPLYLQLIFYWNIMLSILFAAEIYCWNFTIEIYF